MGSKRVKSTTIITASEQKISKTDKPINHSITLSLGGVEIGTRKVERGFLCELGLGKGGGLRFFSTGLLALFDFLNMCYVSL